MFHILHVCKVLLVAHYVSFFFLRVRIEVLRAIGTRLTNGKRTAYCVATHAKPYLSVGPSSSAASGGNCDKILYFFLLVLHFFVKCIMPISLKGVERHTDMLRQLRLLVSSWNIGIWSELMTRPDHISEVILQTYYSLVRPWYRYNYSRHGAFLTYTCTS